MAYSKYSSINNVSKKTEEDFLKNCPALPSGEENCIALEKIHGCNLGITGKGNECYVQSRNRIIGENENFLNVKLDELKNNFRVLQSLISSSPQGEKENNEIVIYGEWFGGLYPHSNVPKSDSSKIVQKGIYYSPNNHFSAFDIKVNGRYLPYPEVMDLCEKSGFMYLKPLRVGKAEELLKFNVEAFKTTIPDIFGLPPIENNFAEGIVIKPITPIYNWKGSRYILKKKRKEYREVKSKTNLKVLHNELPSELIEQLENMLTYCTTNRLNNILSKDNMELSFKNLHKISGLMVANVICEFENEQEKMGLGYTGDELKQYTKKMKIDLQRECIKIVKGQIQNN